MLTGFRRSIIAAILLVANSLSAHAVDEIQVYNAEIAKVGQWTMQLHLNYAFLGRKEPDFPGGLIPHRALNGAPEWAYGITDWWEMGFYAPFAVDQNGTSYSNSIRAPSMPYYRIYHLGNGELTINLKTAKALGLEIPPTLLARADEVIE